MAGWLQSYSAPIASCCYKGWFFSRRWDVVVGSENLKRVKAVHVETTVSRCLFILYKIAVCKAQFNGLGFVKQGCVGHSCICHPFFYRSHPLFRALYLPLLSPRYTSYTHYHLLRNKKRRTRQSPPISSHMTSM